MAIQVWLILFATNNKLITRLQKRSHVSIPESWPSHAVQIHVVYDDFLQHSMIGYERHKHKHKNIVEA